MNKSSEKNTTLKGFTLVEVIVAITIVAILGTIFMPSLTSYLDEAHKTNASIECGYVISAAQSEIITLYADGQLSKVLDKGGFTITSNKIKKIDSDNTIDSIITLAETEGTIQCIWVNEDLVEIAGLAYLTADGNYYVIYSPESEETRYIYSALEESDEYRKQLRKLEDSKWE